MSQYSEVIGSFLRRGNFPLEADYIFPNEEALRNYCTENEAILHKGLLKIVEDDGSGEQALYWIKGDPLEVSKLISGNGLDDLNTKLDELKESLDKEIQERKEADSAIWGTEDKTQVPDDLNSLIDLANAILELKEEIKNIKEEQSTLKEELKSTVGTEDDNIIEYLSTLDYKSLTELSNELNRFLYTVNEENHDIETFPELLNFLEGYNDTDTLQNLLSGIVNDIMGDPYPSDEFRTLRNIEDFVRLLKSTSENSDQNLQSELNQTQIGVGLDSTGLFSPDKETKYLQNATSVMNALRILDSLIDEAINNCNIQGSETSTASVKIHKYVDKTEVQVDVAVSSEQGNSIIIKPDGLYHNINSVYENGILTLYVNGIVTAQHVLGLSYIGIQGAYYDPNTESLVINFRKENGETDELRIPLHTLIREWVVDNSGASDVVILNRVEKLGGEADTLSADVRIHPNKYNILTKVGNALYVEGTADNIVWNDIKVSVALANLEGDVKKLDGDLIAVTTRVSNIEEKLSSASEDLNDHIRDFNNPHRVTKDQVGLGLVENIAPLDMPLSNPTKQYITEVLSWNEA